MSATKPTEVLTIVGNAESDEIAREVKAELKRALSRLQQKGARPMIPRPKSPRVPFRVARFSDLRSTRDDTRPRPRDYRLRSSSRPSSEQSRLSGSRGTGKTPLSTPWRRTLWNPDQGTCSSRRRRRFLRPCTCPCRLLLPCTGHCQFCTQAPRASGFQLGPETPSSQTHSGSSSRRYPAPKRTSPSRRR